MRHADHTRSVVYEPLRGWWVRSGMYRDRTPHLVALVRNRATFHKGKLLERPVDITPAEPDNPRETEVA